jgi:hypothetical protein
MHRVVLPAYRTGVRWGRHVVGYRAAIRVDGMPVLGRYDLYVVVMPVKVAEEVSR